MEAWRFYRDSHIEFGFSGFEHRPSFTYVLPFRPRKQILQFLGLSLSDFKKPEDALALVEKEVETNKAEFGHHRTVEPNDNPLLTRIWYVKSLGKTNTKSDHEVKELVGSTKELKKGQIMMAQTFVEGIGVEAKPEGGQNNLEVKEEKPEFKAAQGKQEDLRSQTQATINMLM